MLGRCVGCGGVEVVLVDFFLFFIFYFFIYYFLFLCLFYCW